MEHTWTKDFYQETDPAKRQQILKEHIGEEEAWEEEYRARLWTARYGQRRLQKDEFVKCLMELKYLADARLHPQFSFGVKASQALRPETLFYSPWAIMAAEIFRNAAMSFPAIKS